jgi:hypothetical protein
MVGLTVERLLQPMPVRMSNKIHAAKADTTTGLTGVAAL